MFGVMVVKKSKIFFYSCIVALLFTTLYYSQMLFVDVSNFSSKDHSVGRIIKRSYADYVDRFMIFLLIGFVVFKEKVIKTLMIFLFLLVIVMEILSGVRGSWGVQIVCFLFLFLFFGGYKNFLIEYKNRIIAFVVLCGTIFILLAVNSYMVSYKILQGINTPERYWIIKERLPTFVSSNRGLIGLGYGKEQYDEFLRDKMDEGVTLSLMQIRQDSGERYWFNDEPFFIGNFYYYGIFGTMMLFLSFLSLLYYSFKYFIQSKNLMFCAIFISIFGYFGVRGLFETINLRILYIFYMAGFFVILSSSFFKKQEKDL